MKIRSICPLLAVLLSSLLVPAGVGAEEATETPTDTAAQQEVHERVNERIRIAQILAEGRALTEDQVRDIEVALVETPGDLDARTRLMGFYDATQQSGHLTRHVLWLIENRPTAPVCDTPICAIDRRFRTDDYERGKELWLAHAKKQDVDTDVLAHAARYFLRNDQQLAESMLLRAAEIEPDNTQWPKRLAGLYSMLRRFGGVEGRLEAGRRSLEQWQRVYELTPDGIGRMRLVPTMAKAAFEAGDLDQARSYAEQSLALVEELEKIGAHGDAVFYGHFVLGKVAVREGDVDGAKAHLLASAETPGSPDLETFGPNMNLAQDLLKLGEKEAVRQYLDRCRSFWARGEAKLDEWIAALDDGRRPRFGNHMLH